MSSINYSDAWTPGTPIHHDDITVDATVGGVQLLAANTARKSAVLQNTGSANIRVTLDASAPTPTHGLQLPPGAEIELTADSVSRSPQGVVKAIRESATSSAVAVMEIV